MPASSRFAIVLLALALAAGACTTAPQEPDEPEDATPPDAEPESEAQDADPEELPGEPSEEDPGAEASDNEPLPLSEVGLTLTPVADADAPTAGAIAPDGTLYVAERAGLVRPLEAGGLGEAVLDLSSETTTDGERGLLGLAFDDAGLYVSYTNPAGHTRVDRMDWNDGAPDAGARETLLAVEQPFANHNGGDIAIGPDGLLWVGLGDGGGAGDPLDTGQDRSEPLGALLRLDPATGEPADGNPFADEEGSDPRIWAYGLRNPWRFSFDAATGDLWIADVGQGDREEVNVVPAGEGAGANFGWSLMEGTVPFDGSEPDDHWPPLFEYDTGDEGCAITGGYVYRGAAVAGLTGAYLFSDYCAGGLRGLRQEDGEVTESTAFDVDGAGSVVSFAQDADGELYLLTFGDGILRVDPS